jgi:hypothetical protein
MGLVNDSPSDHSSWGDHVTGMFNRSLLDATENGCAANFSSRFD